MEDDVLGEALDVGGLIFLFMVAIAKEMWWTRLKGLNTSTLFYQGFIYIFRFHLKRKVRLDRKQLSPSKFVEKLMNVAKKGSTLSVRV